MVQMFNIYGKDKYNIMEVSEDKRDMMEGDGAPRVPCPRCF